MTTSQNQQWSLVGTADVEEAALSEGPCPLAKGSQIRIFNSFATLSLPRFSLDCHETSGTLKRVPEFRDSTPHPGTLDGQGPRGSTRGTNERKLARMKGLVLCGAKRGPGVTIWQSCSRTGLDKRNGPRKKCSSAEVHAWSWACKG